MELIIHYTALPEGMDDVRMKAELDDVLEDAGWLTGSQHSDKGGWVELELEDEHNNPKYGILAVRSYLQRSKFPADTDIELAGTPVCIYD